jgi:hypothetical protein
VGDDAWNGFMEDHVSYFLVERLAVEDIPFGTEVFSELSHYLHSSVSHQNTFILKIGMEDGQKDLGLFGSLIKFTKLRKDHDSYKLRNLALSFN